MNSALGVAATHRATRAETQLVGAQTQHSAVPRVQNCHSKTTRVIQPWSVSLNRGNRGGEKTMRNTNSERSVFESCHDSSYPYIHETTLAPVAHSIHPRPTHVTAIVLYRTFVISSIVHCQQT